MQQTYSERAFGGRIPDEAERRTHQSERDRAAYLATREAARYLGVSTSFLEKGRHFGTGPAYVRFGRAIRYSRVALDAWAADRRATCTADYNGEAA